MYTKHAYFIKNYNQLYSSKKEFRVSLSIQ